MAAYLPPTLLYQLQGLQGKPLLQKCIETEDIIKRTSTKELRLVLPVLLQNIFGFENEEGWGLDRVSRTSHYEEFNQVRRLLSAEGPVLTLVYSLQIDGYMTYEFPLRCLPTPSRRAIEEGVVPFFYINKVQTQALGLPIVLLNAFELYMFHFAYALVSPQWQQRGTSWSNLFDFLYPALVDDYLAAFLPLDRWTFPVLPHMAAPVRSPVRQVPVSGHQMSSHASFFPPRLQKTSLFKPGFPLTQPAQSSPVLENTETETWGSETILQTFVEFWLSQNSIMTDIPGYSHGMMHHSMYSLKSDPFNFLFVALVKVLMQTAMACMMKRLNKVLEHFMPSLNHMKIVRLLVKYLHYFANSAIPIGTSQYQHHADNPLDNLKRSVIPHILQKKLYCFLRCAFARWPLDCYFRMVLETWLSYIQPWRYTDISCLRRNKYQKQSDAGLHERRVEDKWEQFVEDNLLFYTVLFQEFVPRVNRMDLTSPESAYMLYRVTKVFSIPNLAPLISKAETEMCGMEIPMNRTAELGGSYLSGPSFQPLVLILPPQLSDMEVPGFRYQPLFTKKTWHDMSKLVQRIVQAHSMLQASVKDAALLSQSRSWLWSFFVSDKSVDGQDVRRAPVHLEQSVSNICTIFKFAKPAGFCSPDATPSLLNDSTMVEDDGMPNCQLTETGPHLTPLGKYQVINNLRRFQNWQTGDPDLQLIRSYENATLVRLLFHICSIINNNFRPQIIELYERKDFLGYIVKVFLAPPLPPTQHILSPVSRETAERLRQPRLSLRFLAAYQNLFLLGVLYLCAHFWLGTGPVGFILLLWCGLLLYGTVCAAAGYLRSHIT